MSRAVLCLGALLATFASACHCRREAPAGSWQFEDDCADALCDFRAERGEIAAETSLLPGEHGLALRPGAVAVREQALPFRGARLEALAWCERDTAVTVELELEGEGGSERATGTFAAGPRWRSAAVELSLRVPRPEVVRSVRLRAPADARCVLDAIYVGTSRGACL